MSTERILKQYRRAVDRIGRKKMMELTGMSYNRVCEMYNGKSPIVNAKVLDHLGWERVVVYMEKKK